MLSVVVYAFMKRCVYACVCIGGYVTFCKCETAVALIFLPSDIFQQNVSEFQPHFQILTKIYSNKKMSRRI